MIKTLIFDFGDVFINLDKAATQRELEQLKLDGFSEEMLKKNQEYEKGEISSEEFTAYYIKCYPHINENQFTNSWNAILVDFPKYRLDFIKKISEGKNFELILLSNTNHIHINWVRENVPFFEEFKSCFDAFYLSQEINFRKPEASIYEFVLNKHQLNPQEVLFIDDTKENTDAAAALGIKTWNINPEKEDVIELFEVKKELLLC